MLEKEDCGGRRLRSEFCWAARSAALSLPGARLSATGLSEALESESESKQSELERQEEGKVEERELKKKKRKCF